MKPHLRWDAIENEITKRYGVDQDLSIVDLGSNHGYIALRAAMRYPAALSIGVEGSVGHGNGGITYRNNKLIVICHSWSSWT